MIAPDRLLGLIGCWLRHAGALRGGRELRFALIESVTPVPGGAACPQNELAVPGPSAAGEESFELGRAPVPQPTDR